MNKQRKVFVIILSIFIILTLMTIVPMVLNPIQRPQRMRMNYILNLTPIGMSIEDVIEIIESRYEKDRHEFTHVSVDLERIYFPKNPRFGVPSHMESYGFELAGEKAIRAHWGSYGVWFSWFYQNVAYVNIVWAFDSEGNLIDVHIWGHAGP